MKYPVTLEEVVLETEGRPDMHMIGVRNGGRQFNLTPDEAEALGLDLIRLSMEVKVRRLAADTFKPAMEPIRTRLKGITDRRAMTRGPHRRLDDKRRARLGSR